MAAVEMGARNPPPEQADDLDDLFDYDVPADIFQDVDTNMEVLSRPTKAPSGDGRKKSVGGLGLDEEIKVTKKRAPIAKLDEDRLLSQAGISKLRKITKERLRFKGKGHEYSDIARLLNVYQLWLDDLYPRAKFADGLAMIEKLGHKKRMQTMRKEWINEGKPKEIPDDIESASKAPEPEQKVLSPSRNPLFDDNYVAMSRPPPTDDWSNDDVFAQPKAPRSSEDGPNQNALAESLFISDGEGVKDIRPGESPPDDDLDALLAEDKLNTESPGAVSQERHDNNHGRESKFDDEMEAMAGLDDMW